MNGTEEDRRNSAYALPGNDPRREDQGSNWQLAQIAALLGIDVARFSEGISPHSKDLLDQSLLMNSLFARIKDPAARSRLIALARDALRNEGTDD